MSNDFWLTSRLAVDLFNRAKKVPFGVKLILNTSIVTVSYHDLNLESFFSFIYARSSLRLRATCCCGVEKRLEKFSIVVFFRSSCTSLKDVWFCAVNVMQSACRLWILSREIAHHLLTQAADLWIIFSFLAKPRSEWINVLNLMLECAALQLAIVQCITSCVRYALSVLCSWDTLANCGILSFLSSRLTWSAISQSTVLLYFPLTLSRIARTLAEVTNGVYSKTSAVFTVHRLFH